MHESQARRVQRLPCKRDGTAFSVCRVSDKRMPERGEMHSDLVSAPGLEPAGEQRCDAEAFDDFVMGSCRLSSDDDSHCRSPRRMPADRRIDHAAALDVTCRERFTVRAASCRTSAVCAVIVFATTRSPLVSLSRRWTIPARGTDASSAA